MKNIDAREFFRKSSYTLIERKVNEEAIRRSYSKRDEKYNLNCNKSFQGVMFFMVF